jgi:hypothetical protein
VYGRTRLRASREGRPGKTSPLPESLLRDAFLTAGLVDVKVAAFSPTHTAVKVVIPKARRA